MTTEERARVEEIEKELQFLKGNLPEFLEQELPILLALVRGQAAQLGKQDERWEKLKERSQLDAWVSDKRMRAFMEELEREQS